MKIAVQEDLPTRFDKLVSTCIFAIGYALIILFLSFLEYPLHHFFQVPLVHLNMNAVYGYLGGFVFFKLCHKPLQNWLRNLRHTDNRRHDLNGLDHGTLPLHVHAYRDPLGGIILEIDDEWKFVSVESKSHLRIAEIQASDLPVN